MEPFEFLEHTADVGIRARGVSLEELFANATRALAELADVWRPGPGEEVDIVVEAGDVEALLVDWLSEVLYAYDSRGSALGGVVVSEVNEENCRGKIALRADGDDSRGLQVKAVTYHQLSVTGGPEGWTATVFVDI